MKRTRILSALVWGGFASAAHAQLVPLSQCGAAIPCSIPVGLRPADAAAVSPYARAGQGNTLISVEAAIGEGLKPKVVTRAVAEDPSERAARLFVKRNPVLAAPDEDADAWKSGVRSSESGALIDPSSRLPTPNS